MKGPLKPIILNKESKAVTHSVALANYAGYDHSRIIELIHNIELSPQSKQMHFYLSRDFTRAGKELLSYYITEDGFLMICARLKGDKVEEMKRVYLQAFSGGEGN